MLLSQVTSHTLGNAQCVSGFPFLFCEKMIEQLFFCKTKTLLMIILETLARCAEQIYRAKTRAGGA